MDLYYFRHFSELNESAKSKLPKELTVPVSALVMVSAMLLAAPFILVGGLIGFVGYSITDKIGKLTSKEKSYAEINDDEFLATVDEMEELRDKLVQMQKKSRYYNLIYQYHKVDTFTDVNSAKHSEINIRECFKRGKIVRPILVVIYYTESGINTYKNFLKTFPNQDIPYYDGENQKYLFNTEETIEYEASRHFESINIQQYPHCDINLTIKGDGIWITIDRKGKSEVRRKADNT